jgi:hypothetical protein
MCDFAGWPVLGWLSPGGIPCLGLVFPLRYRVRAKSSNNLAQLTLESFLQGLKEAGFVDGKNVTIEYRWAEGHYDPRRN